MLAEISDQLRRGDAQAAASAARALVQSEPENAQAHHLLGLALHKLGDLGGARHSLDQAIALAPEQAMFQLSRASVALGANELQQAEQGLRDSVALDPNLLPAYVALVHLALAQGRNDEAARQLQLARRVDPDHPQVLVAEGHVAQLGGRNEDALRCFTAAVKADPRFALGQVSLGMAYLGRQHWAFAEQAFRNALDLDAGNPGVLRVLAESLRRQGKAEEAIAVLDRLVALRDEAPARAVRGELRLATGQADAALEDFLVVLDQLPAQPAVLKVAVTELARQGRFGLAIAKAEAALAASPLDDTWLLRLGLSAASRDDARAVLDRWLAQQPGSPLALERLALWHESVGDFDEARRIAGRCLELDPGMVAAQFLLVRADIRDDPASALPRLQSLETAAKRPEAERMVLAWRALALDRLGRYDEAATTWRRMIRHTVRGHLLPKPLPAGERGDASGGRLLWAPPGVRLERILRALDPVLGRRLLADRTHPNGRVDGFGFDRNPPGSAASWAEALQSRGQQPAEVVDWIPFIDEATLTALDGAKLTAVVIDPRDALLNWMVYGSAQGYIFPLNASNGATWLALGLEALAARREACPDQVALVQADALDTEAAAIGGKLQDSLALPSPPDAELLCQPVLALGGLPNQFPPGHWRHYREAFAEEFALLSPVAVRLGYPAD